MLYNWPACKNVCPPLVYNVVNSVCSSVLLCFNLELNEKIMWPLMLLLENLQISKNQEEIMKLKNFYLTESTGGFSKIKQEFKVM